MAVADRKKQPSTFPIDLDHPGAIPALRAYAKASTSAEERANIEDLMDDVAHEQRKAKRRAELTKATPSPDKAAGASLDNVTAMPAAAARETADAEDDTAYAMDDLNVDESPRPVA